MQSRFKKLEEAKNLVLSNIFRSKIEITQISAQAKLIETYLTLRGQDLLIIGKHDRFKITKTSSRQLEDMLNLLQQFSLIYKYERVCGDVFRVEIWLKPKVKNVRIITLQNLMKAA